MYEWRLIATHTVLDGTTVDFAAYDRAINQLAFAALAAASKPSFRWRDTRLSPSVTFPMIANDGLPLLAERDGEGGFCNVDAGGRGSFWYVRSRGSSAGAPLGLLFKAEHHGASMSLRMGVGAAEPRLIYASSQPLTRDNLAAACERIEDVRGHDGRRFCEATTLLVPHSLRGDAELIVHGLDTVVVPWLS